MELEKRLYNKKEQKVRLNTVKNTLFLCNKIIKGLKFAYMHQFPGNVSIDKDTGVISVKSLEVDYMSSLSKKMKEKSESMQLSFIILNLIRSKCLFTMTKQDSVSHVKKLYTLEQKLYDEPFGYSTMSNGINKSANIIVYNRSPREVRNIFESYNSMVQDMIGREKSYTFTEPFELTKSGMLQLEKWIGRLCGVMGNVKKFKNKTLKTNTKFMNKNHKLDWYSIIKPNAVKAYSTLIYSLK